METIQMNAKAKSDGSGSRVVVPHSHQDPSVSGTHQGVSESPNGHVPDKSPKNPKDDPDKSLDDLESTLEGYFSYIGAKINDVATAGTAPKDEVDPGGKNTCQVCGQANSSWFEMRKHMRTHSDFRPYKCNMCPRSFHDMYKLKRHLVVHTGLKPYQCHICDQRLSRAEHLRRHLLIHKETKPFKCNLCDFSARRVDSVRSHQRSKHQGEWVQVVTVRSIVDIVSDETTANTNLTPPLHGKKKKKKKKKQRLLPGIGEGEAAAGAGGGGASGSGGMGGQMVNTTNSCHNPNSGLPMQGVVDESVSSNKNENNSRPIPGIASLRTPSLYGMPGNNQGFPYSQPQHHHPHHHQQQQQQQQQTGVSPVSSSSSKMSDSSPSPNKVKNEGSGSASCPKYMTPGGSGSASGSHTSSSAPSGSGLISPPPVSMPGQPGLCPSLHPVMTMAVDPASQAAFNLQAAGGMNYYPGLPSQYGLGPGGQSFSPYFAMKPVFPEAMPVNHHHHHHPPPHHHHGHPLHGHRVGAGSNTSPSSSSGGGVKQESAVNSSHSSPVNMSYSAKMGSPNS